MSRDNSDVKNLFNHLGLDSEHYKSVSASQASSNKKIWALINAANDSPPVPVAPVLRQSDLSESDSEEEITNRDKQEAPTKVEVRQAVEKSEPKQSLADKLKNGTVKQADEANAQPVEDARDAGAEAKARLRHSDSIDPAFADTDSEEPDVDGDMSDAASEFLNSVSGVALSPESNRSKESVNGGSKEKVAPKPKAESEDSGNDKAENKTDAAPAPAATDADKNVPASPRPMSAAAAPTAPQFVRHTKVSTKTGSAKEAEAAKETLADDTNKSESQKEQPAAKQEDKSAKSPLVSAFSRLRGQVNGPSLESGSDEGKVPESNQNNNNELQSIFKRIHKPR